MPPLRSIANSCASSATRDQQAFPPLSSRGSPRDLAFSFPPGQQVLLRGSKFVDSRRTAGGDGNTAPIPSAPHEILAHQGWCELRDLRLTLLNHYNRSQPILNSRSKICQPAAVHPQDANGPLHLSNWSTLRFHTLRSGFRLRLGEVESALIVARREDDRRSCQSGLSRSVAPHPPRG